MTVLIIPSVAFASWWNPFTWFQKKPQAVQVVSVPSAGIKEQTKTQVQVSTVPASLPAVPVPAKPSTPKPSVTTAPLGIKPVLPPVTPTPQLSSVVFSPSSGAPGTTVTLLNAFSLTCTSLPSLCIPNDFYKNKFGWTKEGQSSAVPALFAVGGFDLSRAGGNLSLGNGSGNTDNEVQFAIPASFSPGVYDLVLQNDTTGANSIRVVASFTVTPN